MNSYIDFNICGYTRLLLAQSEEIKQCNETIEISQKLNL